MEHRKSRNNMTKGSILTAGELRSIIKDVPDNYGIRMSITGTIDGDAPAYAREVEIDSDPSGGDVEHGIVRLSGNDNFGFPSPQASY